MRYDEALIDYGSAADRPRNLFAVFVPSEQPVFAISFIFLSFQISSLQEGFWYVVASTNIRARAIALKFIDFHWFTTKQPLKVRNRLNLEINTAKLIKRVDGYEIEKFNECLGKISFLRRNRLLEFTFYQPKNGTPFSAQRNDRESSWQSEKYFH